MAMACEEAAVDDLLSFFVDLLRTLHAQLEIGVGPVSRSPAQPPPLSREFLFYLWAYASRRDCGLTTDSACLPALYLDEAAVALHQLGAHARAHARSTDGSVRIIISGRSRVHQDHNVCFQLRCQSIASVHAGGTVSRPAGQHDGMLCCTRLR